MTKRNSGSIISQKKIKKRNTIITNSNLKVKNILNIENENNQKSPINLNIKKTKSKSKYSSVIYLPNQLNEIQNKIKKKYFKHSSIDNNIKINQELKLKKILEQKATKNQLNISLIKKNKNKIQNDIKSVNSNNKNISNKKLKKSNKPLNLINRKNKNDNIPNKKKDKIINKIFQEQDKKSRNDNLFNNSYHNSVISEGSNCNIIQKSFDVDNQNNIEKISDINSKKNKLSSNSLKKESSLKLTKKNSMNLSENSFKNIFKKSTHQNQRVNSIKNNNLFENDFKHTNTYNNKNEFIKNRLLRNNSSFKSLRHILKETIILRPEEINLSLLKKSTIKRKLKINERNIDKNNNLTVIKNKNLKNINKSINSVNLGYINDKEINRKNNSDTDNTKKLNISQLESKYTLNTENESLKTLKENKLKNKEISEDKELTNESNNPILRKQTMYFEKYRKLYHKKNIYDSLDDEEFDEGDDGSSIYIDPNSKFILIFDGMLFLMTMICFIITPFYLSMTHDFCKEPKLYFSGLINSFTELLYICDLFLGFFRAYYNFDEQLVCKKRKIIKKYLTDWFLFDLISSIPIYTIKKFSEPFCNDYELQTKYYNYVLNNFSYMLICNKLFKVYKVNVNNQARKVLSNKLSDNLNFIFTICVVIASLNYFACLYIFIARNSYPNWILKTGLGTKPFIHIYTCAIYILVMAFTTVGYGDITCYNFYERIYQLFLLIVGSVAYSYLVSYISNYVQKIDEKSADFNKKKSILDEIRYNNPKLSEELYEKILRHLIYKNSYEKKQKNLIFDCLPISLKNTLIYEMYKPIIKNFIFFKNFQNTDFIVRVILSFRAIIAYKNDILVNAGDKIEDIMFVKKGILSIELPINISNPQENIDKYLNNPTLNEEKDPNLKKIEDTAISNGKTMIYKSFFYPNNKNNNNKKTSIQNTTLIGTNFEASRINSLNYNKKPSNNEKEKKISTDEIRYVRILGIRENEHFGDVLMFLEQRSPLRLRVRSKKCELFFLKKIDAIKISSSYQNIWRRINKKSIFNYEQIIKTIKKIVSLYCSIKKDNIKDKKEKSDNIYEKLINETQMGIKESVINIRPKNLDLNSSALSTIKEVNFKRSQSSNCRKINFNKMLFKKKKIDNNFDMNKNNYKKGKYFSSSKIQNKFKLEIPRSNRNKLELSSSSSSLSIKKNKKKKIKKKKNKNKLFDAYNGKYKYYKGKENSLSEIKKKIIINEETENEDSLNPEKLTDISKTIMDPKKFKKLIKSISIKDQRKISKIKSIKNNKNNNKNISLNKNSSKTLKIDDSYSVKFFNEDDNIGLIENNDEEDSDSINFSYEKSVNKELYPGEEFEINKDDNKLLFNKKLNDIYPKKDLNSELHNSNEYKNTKIQKLLNSNEKEYELIDKEGFKNNNANENGNDSYNYISCINKINNNIEVSKNLFSINNHKKKRIFEQNILSIYKNNSFIYESSYDNCNLITGEKLIKNKVLKEKLKKFLLNEINILSPKINRMIELSPQKVIKSKLQNPIYKSDNKDNNKDNSLNISPLNSPYTNRIVKKKIRKVSSVMEKKSEPLNLKNKTLLRTLSNNENNIKPIMKVSVENINKENNLLNKRKENLRRQMSAKDFFYLNSNLASQTKESYKKLLSKKSLKNFSPIFKLKKKQDNILSQIDLNIEKTNQNLNNPEEFYSNYFNQLLEERKKKGKNDINYSGIFGQPQNNDKPKNKKNNY